MESPAKLQTFVPAPPAQFISRRATVRLPLDTFFGAMTWMSLTAELLTSKVQDAIETAQSGLRGVRLVGSA